MYSGKFSNDNSSHRAGRYAQHRRPAHGRKRFAALMVSLLILVTAAAGGTLAYLAAETTPVENTFTYGKVPIKIQEEFEDGVKKNVTVQNTGNVDAFVRVMVVMTWKDADGYVNSQSVVATDLNFTAGSRDWVKGSDGYYYYVNPVPAGQSTPALIKNLSVNHERADIPEGYDLSVEILAQSVQAQGMKNGVPMVKDAWDVDVSGGRLVP